MLETLLIATAAACCSCPATLDRSAEALTQAPPTGQNGVIVATSDKWVDLRKADGSVVRVDMTDGWTVTTGRPAAAGELGVGDFVASANSNVEPGHGRANELRIFEPGYQPEYGTHTMQPDVSMTHGFVFEAATSGDMTSLQVAYPGGCRVIDVPAGTRLMTYDLHPREFATPGMKAGAVLRKGADGVLRAGRITVQP